MNVLNNILKRCMPGTERRLHIFETNYGREAGWYMEHNDRCIAVLTDIHPRDMFLDSYRVEPMMQNVEERMKLMTSPEFWQEEEITFRNRRFGDIAPHAVALGHPDSNEGRVLMRGLYLHSGTPRLWEKMLLWWRKSVIRSNS